jgi:hypothetical protein
VAQHFLLSPAAKTLTLAHVMRMTDQEAEATFKAVRWADSQGEPVCRASEPAGGFGGETRQVGRFHGVLAAAHQHEAVTCPGTKRIINC